MNNSALRATKIGKYLYFTNKNYETFAHGENCHVQFCKLTDIAGTILLLNDCDKTRSIIVLTSTGSAVK